MDLKHLVPDPSIDNNRPSRRRGSSTSSRSESSTGPGSDSKRRSQRSPRTKTKRSSASAELQGASATDFNLNASSSRRESASSMRTTSTMDDPVTYTPTTHRVSKAKKGKRVHACEHPGCNKVFTRAEHRRRHELNHSPEASFPCLRPDCRKAFHRPDLLQRHMERHDLEEQAAATGTPLSRRTSAHQSLVPELSPAMTAQSMASPPLVSHPVQPHHGHPLNIGSLVHPRNTDHVSFNAFPGIDFTSHTRNMYPMAVVNSDDSSGHFYSSPESCQSPVSDHYPRYGNHRNSLSSSSSGYDMYPSTSNPMSAATLPGWTSVPPTNINPSHSMDEDVSALQSVELPVSVSLSFSDLDGVDWTTLRRELGLAHGVLSDHSGLAVIDSNKWVQCVELYERFFNPLFPVVVMPRPTFGPFKPTPLLAGIILGVGSQYDPAPNSKVFSMSLLEASSRILNKREHASGRSRLADLQTIFILEALNKFGSRRVDIETSSRFRFLYASLSQARHWVQTSPLAVLKSLKGTCNPVELKRAYSFWLEHETRRRILQACFILDTFQAILFDQPSALGQSADHNLDTSHMQGDMPFPCFSTLWESDSAQGWSTLATQHINDELSLQDATNLALSPFVCKPMDTFQSILVFSEILMRRCRRSTFESDLQSFYTNLTAFNSSNQSPDPLVEFTYHALLAAHYTPLRALLMVSGESWLYGKKVEEQDEFRAAKRTLRDWVDASSLDKENAADADVLKAVWHSTRLLGLVLGLPMIALHGSPSASRAFSTATPVGRGAVSSIGDLLSEMPLPLNMLHESWSIYVCSLICWAFGIDSTSTAAASMSNGSSSRTSVSGASTGSSFSTASSHPALLPPHAALAEAQSYLATLTCGQFMSPTDLLSLDPDVRNSTDGLLETIRTRRLSSGDSGLVNDAEGVLFRLVEKRGSGWRF